MRAPPSFDQLPSTTRPERDGRNAIEQLAVATVRREIAAMPASLVVQLALWPGEIAGWAREIHASESLVYNMLAARKPYARTRALLAERLEVRVSMVDHLVEARRAVAASRRGPDGWGAPLADAGADDEPIDWTAAPFPRRRDGTNPVERRAVRVIEVDVASLPAATVVGLAMWPESLSEWSRAQRLKASVVWATLAGAPSVPVRDALARRLGVAPRSLDALITSARAVPRARQLVSPPAGLADVAPTPPPARQPTRAEQLGFEL